MSVPDKIANAIERLIKATKAVQNVEFHEPKYADTIREFWRARTYLDDQIKEHIVSIEATKPKSSIFRGRTNP